LGELFINLNHLPPICPAENKAYNKHGNTQISITNRLKCIKYRMSIGHYQKRKAIQLTLHNIQTHDIKLQVGINPDDSHINHGKSYA
jgi:hypothetical protein